MATDNGGDGALPAEGQPAPEENALVHAAAATEGAPVGQEEAQEGSGDAPATQEPAKEEAAQKPRQRDWATKRIDELTRQRHDESRRAAQLERELDAARAIIAGKKPEAGGDAAAPTAVATAQPAPQDFNAAVEREAARIASEQSFNARCNTAFDAGVKEHGADFREGVADLNRAGILSRTFVEAALETDAPAKLLHHLGQDVAEAQRIAALPPTKMAIELDRLAQRVAKPTAAAISKAPAPITPVGGTVKGSFDFADPNADDAEWYRRREEARSKRT